MDTRLSLSALLALLALGLLATPAEADIYKCLTSAGHISIQDKPCGGGSRVQKVYRDAENAAPRRSRSPARAGESSSGDVAAAPAAASKGNGGGVPVGLKNQRNKDVICGLLGAEKSEALEQIAGRLPPPAGENPNDNLVKIERQRARVACDS